MGGVEINNLESKKLLQGGAISTFSDLIGEGNNTIHESVPEAPPVPVVEAESSKEQVEKDVTKDLKQADIFKTTNVKDFSDFYIEGNIYKDGQINFFVEQCFLKDAAAVTRLTVGAAGTNTGNVRFVLINDRVKLSSFNQAAFAEVIIPLVKPIIGNFGDSVNGEQFAFIFDQRVLNRIADFVDEVIEFRVDYNKLLLVVQAGKTHLEFSILPDSEFIQYKGKIENPQYVDKVNTEILSESISYISQFIKRDDVQINFSLADCRLGQIVGGSYAAVGIFSAEALTSIPFRVKYEALGIISKALQHFSLENTHLFNTEKYYILRDENLYIGWERTQSSFPPVEKYLETETTGDVVIIPRRQLLNSLSKLSVVSATKDHPILCKVSGFEDSSVLNISIQDIAGKVSQDELKVFRTMENRTTTEKDSDLVFVLNMEMLIIATSHFDTANMHLKVISGKAVLLEDFIAERFAAHTVISMAG